MPCPSGFCNTPFSVTRAVSSEAGVTLKAGLSVLTGKAGAGLTIESCPIIGIDMQALFDIQLMPWKQARALAQPVRSTVFVAEQGVPAHLEWDEWDGASIHAIAAAGNTVIGTARLLPADAQGIVRVGRMAVLKPWRGRGAGAAMLAALLAEASRLGAKEAVLHAQTYAAGFYRRYGFSERGAEFLEAGIAHVEMSRRLDTASGRGGAARG